MTTILGTKQLLERILIAIHDSGWHVKVLSSQKPFYMTLYQGYETINLIVYIWNMTHGGYPRSELEYRIQVKEKSPLVSQDKFKTLILGWSEEFEIFAGFDFYKHLAPKYSASLQIRKEFLQEAYIRGMSFQNKGNDEIAIAFRPDFFVSYASHSQLLHHFGDSAVDLAVLQEIPVKSENPIGGIEQLEDIPIIQPERKTLVLTLSKKLRDTSFRKRVLTAYRNKCAFCGIQLNLVDAAHILPVSYEGATDETSNGICLCVLHHRAYDNSLVTFDADYYIQVNEKQMIKLREMNFHLGEDKFRDDLRKVILLPPTPNDRPNPQYIRSANELRGWD